MRDDHPLPLLALTHDARAELGLAACLFGVVFLLFWSITELRDIRRIQRELQAISDEVEPLIAAYQRERDSSAPSPRHARADELTRYRASQRRDEA